MNNRNRFIVIVFVVIVVIAVIIGGVFAFRPKNGNSPTSTKTTSSNSPTTPVQTSTTHSSIPTSTTPSASPLPTTSITISPTTQQPVTSTTTVPVTTLAPPPVIDFSKWLAESYTPMSDEDYAQASWDISADKKTVVQNANCQPSLFYSDFMAMNKKVQVNIKPMTTAEPDDDYFGFALGVQPGDAKNHQASYILIDWKNSIPGENLNKDFLGGGAGGLAKIGLAISRVNGIPTPDEFWQHTDDTQGSPQGEGLTELSRAVTLGNTGWAFEHEYVFTFEFTKTTLKVYVDGNLEITITGNFTDGRLAFYNFSQAGVSYTAS